MYPPPGRDWCLGSTDVSGWDAGHDDGPRSSYSATLYRKRKEWGETLSPGNPYLPRHEDQGTPSLEGPENPPRPFHLPPSELPQVSDYPPPPSPPSREVPEGRPTPVVYSPDSGPEQCEVETQGKYPKELSS